MAKQLTSQLDVYFAKPIGEKWKKQRYNSYQYHNAKRNTSPIFYKECAHWVCCTGKNERRAILLHLTAIILQLTIFAVTKSPWEDILISFSIVKDLLCLPPDHSHFPDPSLFNKLIPFGNKKSPIFLCTDNIFQWNSLTQTVGTIPFTSNNSIITAKWASKRTTQHYQPEKNHTKF